MYSPIKKIYIQDFRNIGKAELSFEESPIICLVGENEAGKTSVVKAFATCALHADPRSQKNFIRSGQNMFGVSIELEDGHIITRMKTNAVNVYRIYQGSEIVWETNKVSEGLPVEVQNLMGLIEEPETKEFLHIRTYEDKLLFVVTPASVNYKVMYDALKVEQLTRAIKKGSAEANNIKNHINLEEASVNTLDAQARSLYISDIEPIRDIKKHLTERLNIIAKLEKALSIKANIDRCNRELGVVRLLDTFNIQSIDITEAMNLNSVYRTLNNINNVKSYKEILSKVDGIETLDISILNKIDNIRNKIVEQDSKKREAGALVDIANLSEINEGLLIQLDRAKSVCNNVDALHTELNKHNVSECTEIDTHTYSRLQRVLQLISNNSSINEQLVTEKAESNKLLDIMKQSGVAFETCPNCGADVLIDIDKIGA